MSYDKFTPDDTIMYKVSKTGKYQVWKCKVQGDSLVVEFGTEGGKQQIKGTPCKGKNIGKANETSPEEQALIELKALYLHQEKNKHYRYTKELADKVVEDCQVPMKIINYKDHKDKVEYPCWVGIKYNGSRAMSISDSIISKAGIAENFKVEGIKKDLQELRRDVDTEVYCHGMSLQQIQSARNKPNADTGRLYAVIFDTPIKDLTIEERISNLRSIKREIRQKDLKHLKVEIPVLVNSEEELNNIFNTVTPEYEGVVIWNTGSLYEFGVRSNFVLKWKPRYDSEARVLSVSEDKNGNGKLHVVACNALANVKFSIMMKVNRRDNKQYPRDFETMKKLEGKWITFSYEELSDKGVPTKPVGENERVCNSKGEPLE